MVSPGTLEKGRKLALLYRRSTGGERQNAGRLLAAHLRTHDLTLYDLEPSLSVTRDLGELDGWRESAALLILLGTPRQDEALTHLVDAADLTETEMNRLLHAVDLGKLASGRVDGWAHSLGGDPVTYLQAANTVTPEAVARQTGSLAARLQAATVHEHFLLTHPERTIRTSSPIQQRFLLGLLGRLSGAPAQMTETGVRARLNVEQLARVRALLSQHGAEAERAALRAAEELGKRLGEKG